MRIINSSIAIIAIRPRVRLRGCRSIVRGSWRNESRRDGWPVGVERLRFHFQVRTESQVMLTEAANCETQTKPVSKPPAHRSVAPRLCGKLWVDEEWQMDVTDDVALILFAIKASALKSAFT